MQNLTLSELDNTIYNYHHSGTDKEFVDSMYELFPKSEAIQRNIKILDLLGGPERLFGAGLHLGMMIAEQRLKSINASKT